MPKAPHRLLAGFLLAAAVLTAPSIGQVTPTPAEPAAAPAEPKLDLGPSGETLITLHVKNAAPEDVFDALAKQAGIHFTPDPPKMWDGFQVGLTIDIDKKPFWVAMQELCKKAGLTVQQANSPKGIGLRRGDAGGDKSPTFISSGFLIRADSITAKRTVQFAQPDRAIGECSLNLTAYRDPNFRILTTSRMFTVTEAVDDKGNSLMPKDMNTFYNGTFGFDREFYRNTNVSLACDKNMGTKITSLKGTMQVSIQTKSEIFEFTDLMAIKEQTKTIGDYTLVVKDVRNTGVQVFVTIEATTTKPANKNGEDHVYTALGSAQVLDEKGKNLSPTRSTIAGSPGGPKWRFIIFFGQDYSVAQGRNPLPDPAKLIAEIPAEVKEISIPVEFKDIPLP